MSVRVSAADTPHRPARVWTRTGDPQPLSLTARQPTAVDKRLPLTVPALYPHLVGVAR
ncbi:hypothetical protein [Streptomyces sp. NPDC012508]|uniref:hypothetical protein n=1 Tax=Streptomyces sp. NPDC012508 TaxID=3364837 RepID=UPI0036A6B259